MGSSGCRHWSSWFGLWFGLGRFFSRRFRSRSSGFWFRLWFGCRNWLGFGLGLRLFFLYRFCLDGRLVIPNGCLNGCRFFSNCRRSLLDLWRRGSWLSNWDRGRCGCGRRRSGFFLRLTDFRLNIHR